MAKKRHHQSVRSRENEAVGMAKAMMHHSKHYTGKHDSGGMIDNDHNAIANMPQAASVKFWPKCADSLLSIPPDDITGIDRQVDQAVHSIERNRTTRKN